MYHDAFTIERLANELKSWLAKGTILKDVFSTSKTDLFFVFSDKKGFKLQLFQGQAFFQFPGIENFPVKNRMAQFPSIHGLEIHSVNIHNNSRSFDIELNNRQRLVFKLFGKFSNVILFDKHPLEIFNLNHQKDLETPLTIYLNSETNILHTFINVSKFDKAYNWFGEDALNYLVSLGYFEAKDKESIYEKFISQYLSKDVAIVKKTDDTYALSSFPNDNSIGYYQSIMDAFNDFTRLFIAAESFKIKKQSQVSNLQRQVNQKQKLVMELMNSIESIKHKRSYSELGDLLMANLHSIHAGTTKVEVLDFYNNAKTLVKIKADLSPQQNAALFYQKAKNQVKELEYKQKSLEVVTAQLELLKQSLEALKEADNAKKLKSLDKSSLYKGTEAKSKEKQPLPYRHYIIGGFEVMVGKNARANDEMLSRFANKNDTWFHAKDISGSHVIIKNHSSKPIPSYVIEQVASLAAWYSKAKSNSLASVIYTLRKYVRKPKGSPPGQVIVERETGILVEPKDYTP